MGKKIREIGFSLFLILSLSILSFADRRGYIYSLGLELEKLATYLAQSSFDHFRGWNGTISDQEQAILFKSEAFLSSCRLFLRLTEERSDYFRNNYLRTNLYSAFIYLAHSFKDLEEEMRKASVMPYALSDCRKIVERVDDEFSKWPSADNLAYLHQRYVKARDATVYMIERKGPGMYIRHAFKNLESIFRYNYDLKRGKDPWKYLVEVSPETLEKLEEGAKIDLTFEGQMVMVLGTGPNRSVYLIDKGKKRGLSDPSVVMRLGGWGKVFEVPAEVINGYPEGESIH